MSERRRTTARGARRKKNIPIRWLDADMGRRVPKRRGGPVAGARRRASGVGAPRLWVRDERSVRGETAEIRGRPGGSRRRAFRARRATPSASTAFKRAGRSGRENPFSYLDRDVLLCLLLSGDDRMPNLGGTVHDDVRGPAALSSAGKTSPNPSRPAPKCTWSLSVGGAGECMRKLQCPRVRCRGCLGRDETHRQGI